MRTHDPPVPPQRAASDVYLTRWQELTFNRVAPVPSPQAALKDSPYATSGLVLPVAKSLAWARNEHLHAARPGPTTSRRLRANAVAAHRRSTPAELRRAMTAPTLNQRDRPVGGCPQQPAPSAPLLRGAFFAAFIKELRRKFASGEVLRATESSRNLCAACCTILHRVVCRHGRAASALRR